MLSLDVGRGVFRSSFLQIAGRVVLGLARLLVASLVVRAFGAERYGEYALVLVLTSLPEWVLDFGLNDIFVREMCQRPGERGRLLAALTATKLFQVLLAYPLLVAVVLVMGFPQAVVRGALIAGAALLFHCGILVYRAHFKAGLRLELDIVAEAVGVAAMLPLLWLACRQRASLEVLALCHVFSRAVYLGVCGWLGSSEFRLGVRGFVWDDVRAGLRQAAPIGIAGLMVGIYEALDSLTLSKLSSAAELGLYSGSQRILWAVLMGLGAVSASLFPVLSASFNERLSGRFERYLQGGLDAVILLAAGLLSGLAGGAEFVLGLLGPQMVAGAPILKVLALACLVKAISMTLGPVLYVTNAQAYALRVTSTALTAKAVLLLLLVPRYGGIGAAVGSLLAELIGAVVPTVILVQRFSSYRLRWSRSLRVLAAALTAHGVIHAIGWAGTFAGGVLAGALCLALAALFRALKPAELRALLPPLARPA